MSAILTTLAVLALLGAGVGAELGLPMVGVSVSVALVIGSVEFLLLALLVVRRVPYSEFPEGNPGKHRS